MICYCPYCVTELPETLINGVTFCDNCSRIIISNKLEELLSAYKLLKKGKYNNYDQMRFHLQLNKDDFNFVLDCFEKDELTVEEFVKKAKALYIK
jgi:Zn-finger protein